MGATQLTVSFFNGGLIFSTVVMLAIAAISLYCFLLLTKTYLVIPGSFGGELTVTVRLAKLTPDIGGALYGKYMRLTILTSITVSQIGFVAGELLRHSL
jgi:proton-coupled amino acid transporter